MNALGAVIGAQALPRRAIGRVGRTLALALRRPSPRLQRGLGIAAAALALLSGLYLLWFRDSSFVSVERVSVTGLETRDAKRMRAALEAAAGTMTTLHVDQDRLMAAVAGYPVVRELNVTADLPHGLQIQVVQHAPAAIAVADGLRIPVAGDGTLLRGVPVEGELPELRVSGALPSERLRAPGALRQAHVLGAAPAELRGRLEKVDETSDKGITVQVREGPELIFGDATRARAKWAAATRVLADPGARGASYIDVRLPDRPAAGGVTAETVVPVAPAGGLPAPLAGNAAAATPEAAGGAAAATDPAAADPAAAPTPTPAPTAPAPGTTDAPQQTQQAPAGPQPAPPAPAPVTQGSPGGGATANPQP